MNFLKRRIVIYVSLMLLVANLIFILPRIAPSNSTIIASPAITIGPAVVFRSMSQLCLNQPIYVQYGCFLRNTFATWPPFFGPSYAYFPEGASNIVLSALPWTLFLIIPSLFASIGLSIIIGKLMNGRLGRLFGGAGRLLGFATNVIPPFWLGIVFIWVFAIYLQWFPPFGSYFTATSGFAANYSAWSILLHYILPFAALTVSTFGYVYGPFQKSYQRVSETKYVLASRMRGLSRGFVVSRYIIRNSFLGMLSASGPIVSGIISADILIEDVFGYRGVGNVLTESMFNRDYPLIEASFFFLTLTSISIALTMDVARYRLDPRLRDGEQDFDKQEVERSVVPELYEESPGPSGQILLGAVQVDPSHYSTLEAFRILEGSLKDSFEDLSEGCTWEEILERLKDTGIEADWETIYSAVKNYEAFRYGGAKLDEKYAIPIVKLVRALPRKEEQSSR